MTCKDCSLELDEDYGSALLAIEMQHLKATGLCYGCGHKRLLNRRIRELKGESHGGTASTTSTTD